MASSRKKQDEKNLKTLREIGALPQNKYCFDCNQRGPTYVNVTIGSYVCTKCSGMLRGITPPHRVKSISMATFTNEEVDLLRSRGNDYCRKVWLGLYEGTLPTSFNDETSIKDFMVEKYERRRYYLDPVHTKSEAVSAAARSTTVPETKPVKISNGTQVANAHRTRPDANKNNNNNNNNNNYSSVFATHFDKVSIFSSNATTKNGNSSPKIQENGFANFENNPVFSNPTTNPTKTGLPTPLSFNNTNNWNGQHNNTAVSVPLNGLSNGGTLNGPAVQEDKYAALKDLDNEIKSQKNLEWNMTGSNGSLYSSSSTPTDSVYGSPTPSQGQFLNSYPLAQENCNSSMSNPFNNGVNWGNQNRLQQPFANPFRDLAKMNGFSHVFQPAFSVTTMPISDSTNGWAPNPFKVETTKNMNSNNPFL